jgi:hypothetical protein
MKKKKNFTWWAMAQLTAARSEGCAAPHTYRPGWYIATPLVNSWTNEKAGPKHILRISPRAKPDPLPLPVAPGHRIQSNGGHQAKSNENNAHPGNHT